MLVRITRPTVAKPTGAGPQAVDVGAEVDVDELQARQLITIRKAVPVVPELADVEPGAEAAVLPRAQRRKRG